MKRALSLIAVLVFAACNQDPTLAAFEQRLDGLVFETPGASFPTGSAIQVKAWALYNDGTKVDVTTQTAWTSAQPSIGSITQSGIVSFASVGATKIEGSFGGKTIVATFFSTSAQIASLDVRSTGSSELPLGDGRQFAATAHFDNGTQLDVTSRAKWTTDGSGRLDLSGATAHVVAHGFGSAWVKAEFQGLSTFALIEVVQPRLIQLEVSVPGGVIRPGNTFKAQAFARFSDGTSQNVTEASTWRQVDAVFAMVGPGSYKANQSGRGRIEVQWNGSNASLQLQVNDRVVTQLAFTRATVSVPKGLQQQAEVVATYDDGSVGIVTELARWSTSNSQLVNVTDSGMVQGRDYGSAVIEAHFSGFTATLFADTGAAVLVSLEATVASVQVQVGETVTFAVRGVYSDGTTIDLSSEVQVIHGTGVVTSYDGVEQTVTGVTIGTQNIEYAFGGYRFAVPVTVANE